MIDDLIKDITTSKTRNQLLTLGLREYIIFVDAWDLKPVDNLSPTIKVLQNNQYTVLVSNTAPTEYCVIRYYSHGGGYK